MGSDERGSLLPASEATSSSSSISESFAPSAGQKSMSSAEEGAVIRVSWDDAAGLDEREDVETETDTGTEPNEECALGTRSSGGIVVCNVSQAS